MAAVGYGGFIGKGHGVILLHINGRAF
ncbi:MAG: hypothetical protein ACJAZ7_001958 [Zhongshania aliphaticivorans]